MHHAAGSAAGKDRLTYWRVEREWAGECCFIVAGGPSVLAQAVERLRGHRVIAINSSWSRVPFAEFLFFGDARWFDLHRDQVVNEFAGRIATCAKGVAHSRVLLLRRQPPPGLALEPDAVALQWTSTSGAMNLAVHLGAARVVLLGVDGRLAEDGRTHHHAPHPWDLRHGWADKQRDELASLVAPLAARRVEVLNASPGSAVPYWPSISFEEALLEQGAAK